MSTHRHVQVHTWSDRAASERVRYYCAAIKATEICNHKAASYFTERAQKWEAIRMRADGRLTA